MNLGGHRNAEKKKEKKVGLWYYEFEVPQESKYLLVI